MSILPTPIARSLIFLPGTAAGAFVRAFIVRDTRGCHLSGPQRLNRFPASSHCMITWFLEGGANLLADDGQQTPLERCVVSGCHASPSTSVNRGDVHCLMAVFYPDAFHALFGIDLKLLQNRSVDARQVLPTHGLELVDAVFSAGSDGERQQTIERFIRDHAPATGMPGWTRLRRMGGQATLVGASALLGIGPRQLQRLALRQVGMNLQTLVRLWRGERSFYAAQRQHFSGKQVVLADHAIATEYADQSHMARDCKAHTGRTPAQLARDVLTEEADWIYRLEFPTDEDCSPARSA